MSRILSLTNTGSVRSAFKNTRKYISLPETIKHNPTFRAKTFRRQENTSRRENGVEMTSYFHIHISIDVASCFLNLSSVWKLRILFHRFIE